jgi:hypothetical protein
MGPFISYRQPTSRNSLWQRQTTDGKDGYVHATLPAKISLTCILGNERHYATITLSDLMGIYPSYNSMKRPCGFAQGCLFAMEVIMSKGNGLKQGIFWNSNM